MAKAPLRCRNEASNHNNGDPGGIIQGPPRLALSCRGFLAIVLNALMKPES
jgi:hypothetical protein